MKSHQPKRRFVPRTPGGKIGAGMKPSDSTFGRFLRKWRLQRGMSQRTLARMLGCSQVRLSSLERGETRRMRESYIAHFARVLTVPEARIRRMLPPAAPLLPALTPLARLLRARREALGFSRKELAGRVGRINDAYVGELERKARELRYGLMVRLARALELEQSTLVRFVAPGVQPPIGAIGTAIRQRRKALGLSASALGDRVGISKTAVLAIEKGKVALTHSRSDRRIARIARVLGMDAAGLAALRQPVVPAHIPPPRSIGEHVARARLARRWSQEELARRAGLGASSICKIESNQVRPHLSSLQTLVRVLDIDVDLLTQLRPPREA